tara:strand:+ start:4745 stop:4987 length:243 start_codon:yes stop_codon:yes gene_type:complete
MAGMFSNNNDFSWNSDTIFDKIGNQETREEYLTELSGTGNNEAELIRQLKSLDKSELRMAVRQMPEDLDRREMLEAYYKT